MVTTQGIDMSGVYFQKVLSRSEKLSSAKRGTYNHFPSWKRLTNLTENCIIVFSKCVVSIHLETRWFCHPEVIHRIHSLNLFVNLKLQIGLQSKDQELCCSILQMSNLVQLQSADSKDLSSKTSEGRRYIC